MNDSAGWRDQVRSRADPPLADRLIRLVELLQARFGVVPRGADGARRDYLALYPPTGGRARVGAITLGSGRFYGVYKEGRRDVLLRDVPRSEPAEHRYLTIYIRSDADFAVAEQLMELALQERGISPRPRDSGPAPDDAEPRPDRSTDGSASDSERESEPDPSASLGRVMAPPISAPIDLESTALDDARKVTSSSTYREAEARFGRRVPEPERVERLLAVLAMDGDLVSFARAAAATGMGLSRVPGFLAAAARLLTIDGVALLAIDSDAREIRLDRQRLAVQFQ